MGAHDSGPITRDSGAKPIVDASKTGSDASSCGAAEPFGFSGSSDPDRAYAETEVRRILDRFVGQYADGRAVVYRGTAAVHTSAGGTVDYAGPVVANLSAPRPYFHSLSITNGVGYRSLLDINEYGDRFAPIDDAATSRPYDVVFTSGSSFKCYDCVPPIARGPAIIDVGVTSLTDELARPATFSLNLRRIAPCSVTFEDLTTLGPMTAITDFTWSSQGNEKVFTRSFFHQTFWNPLPEAGQPAKDVCSRTVWISMDLVVSASPPWIYGVRNYVAGQPQIDCYDYGA